MINLLTREIPHSQRVTPFGYPVVVAIPYVLFTYFALMILPALSASW